MSNTDVVAEQLDLKLLRYFVVLLEEQSVSRAAARLDVTQSALSHALRRLRNLLDDPLVMRSSGRMKATERALELQQIALAILHDVDRMVSKPLDFDPASSSVKFLMTSTLSFDWLLMPLLVERMRREAPCTTLETWSPNSELGDIWIEYGKIDFRLGWVPHPSPELRFQTLYTDHCVCIARHGHPRLEGRITFEQFLRFSHVRVANARRVNHYVDQALNALGASELHIPFIAHSYDAVMQSVARTDLIAVVPSRIVGASADALGIQVLNPPFELPEMPVAVYWHERTHAKPSHRWFRRLIADIARQHEASRVPL